MSARLGQIEVLDSAGNTVGWITRILAPGAVADNGLLKLAPGAPADTHVHYVSEFSSFAAAVTALTGAGHQHLIVPTLLTLTAPVTVPDTITVECIGAGGFTASSSFDLTLKGCFLSDPTQRFFGSVNVKFVQTDSAPNTSLAWVFAEWWGAQGNDSTDDTAAFNKALNAIKTSRGIALRLLARPYKASVVIPAPSNEVYPVTILGSGDGSSIRTASASIPALSLDLGVSDPNCTVILRDFSLGGRGTMTVPTLSLKAQGGTSNRFFGVVDNVRVIGSGNQADTVYIRGGLALDLNLRTQEGRYALYLEGSSNTIVKLHAGHNTCAGIMIKGGGSSTITRARVEDSASSVFSRTISSITGSGTVVTVTTSAPHNFETMDRVTVSGAGGFNFTTPRRITVTSATTFTYAGAETGSGSAGTALWAASSLRMKNTSFNVINDFANEGKTNLAYTLWLQSDSTTVTGEPSCAHNVFSGGIFGGPADTVRTTLSTVLMEGPCVGNQGVGATIGRALPYNSNSWEFRFEQNEVGVRPRHNEFRGGTYTGTGGSLNFKMYEDFEGALGNYVELFEKSVERMHVYGNRRNINASFSIDDYAAGTTIYTSGASATVLISLVFNSYPGVRPVTFINNSAQLLRIDPNGSETIGAGGAGKYLELPAGASAVLGCMVAGKWDVLFSSGALTYEPYLSFARSSVGVPIVTA